MDQRGCGIPRESQRQAQNSAYCLRVVTEEYGEAIILDHLDSVEMSQSQPVIYDREIGVRLLYEDPHSGAEHYLIRYPAGLNARLHRHTAAHTIVVLEGELAVNNQVIGPGAYCHFPAGETMSHAPAGDRACLLVTIFHGPFDVEPLGDEGMRRGTP
jgi:quercetin dioxygenase-like cupin family protein